MDEQRALQIIDEELNAALGGLTAPPHLSAAVLRRTTARPARLPEILDAIGWLAVLAAVLAVGLYFAPPFEWNVTSLTIATGIAVAIAFTFALRTLSEPRP